MSAARRHSSLTVSRLQASPNSAQFRSIPDRRVATGGVPGPGPQSLFTLFQSFSPSRSEFSLWPSSSLHCSPPTPAGSYTLYSLLSRPPPPISPVLLLTCSGRSRPPKSILCALVGSSSCLRSRSNPPLWPQWFPFRLLACSLPPASRTRRPRVPFAPARRLRKRRSALPQNKAGGCAQFLVSQALSAGGQQRQGADTSVGIPG